MKILLSLLLLLSSSAFADEWTTGDTYREVGFQFLNVIDWGQTRYIAEQPDVCASSTSNGTTSTTCVSYKEIDSARYIGEKPTTGRVDAYMASVAVLHLAVSYFLPREWRTAFQYITIGDKLNATIGNASIGIKVSF